MRWNGPLRYYADDTVTLDTTEWEFDETNVWYQFSFDNVDIVAGTWDFTVSLWDDGTEDFIDSISRTGLAFENSVSDLAQMGIMHNAAGTNPGTNIDNFAIIPEPSTFALLFGMSAFGFILWRRRKA